MALTFAGALGLFSLGLVLSLPPAQPTQTIRPTGMPTGMAVVGKPDVDASRKTQTPAPFPVRTEEPRSDAGVGWIVNEGTKAHAGPGLNQPSLATLRYGARVRLLEKTDNWQHIMLDDKRAAYVQAQFVNATRPADVPKPGPEDALKVIQGFFADLNKHSYSSAYDRLSFEFKRSLSYATFARGYAEDVELSYRVVRAESLAGERFVFYLEQVSSEGRRQKGHKGTYVAVQEQGDWKISQIDLEEVDASKLDPFPPGEGATPEKKPFADPTIDEEDADG